ncbi:glycosyltransferase [Patescibacteria group bacterium]|nr:glycosyltransferase [Patescibacteria group bacterium]
MKRRFFVSAIYFGPPGTMGGHMKILFELINNLYHQFDFIVLTSEPETFKLNLEAATKVEIIGIPYPYLKVSLRTHLEEVRYVSRMYQEYFAQHPLQPSDIFYTATDFAPDVIPVWKLKERFHFEWLASFFLFVPSPLSNLQHQYGFPVVKYILYYLYQKFLFTKIRQRANACLLTNDSDRRFFPQSEQKQLHAIYGGVNVEDVRVAQRHDQKLEIKFDAVFCSRLHEQKGISRLLDIWKEVTAVLANAQLAIIGNGDPAYEQYLHQKAEQLGIQDNLTWMGYVNGVEKYRIYLQSKLLTHATVYDNNGMVAAEALCTGLPVVMYDLPEFQTLYTTGCVKVPPGDMKQYSQSVIKLLTDEQYYQTVHPTKKEQQKLQQLWSWSQKATDFAHFIQKTL